MADSKAQKDQNPSSDEPRKEASGVHVSLSENAENSHSRLNCPVTDEIDRIGEERQKIGDSLSLYVEFVGSESELRHQNAEDVELAEIKEENVGNCLFSVGDVVWVKTRNQNWCVGEIYDPSTASSYCVKPNPKKPGFFLVGHFVSGNVAWYSLPQLKPFYSNFAELSETSESRSFLCAVEKGVEQFGKNVISKLRRGRKDDDFGEIASVIINPKNLIAYVKSLAVSVAASIPIATLDLSIVGNYLSLFYCSMGSGEDELMKSPLKKGNSNLKPKNKKKRNRYLGNGSGNSNVEGSESRSRKKSKYLSYPYINLEKKESLTEKSPVLAINSVSIPEMVSVPSTEILSELRDAAVEPACIKESRNFDKIEVLLYKFRSFLYRDDEDDSKNVVDEEKVAGGADPSPKIEPKKRRKREKKKKKELELKPGIVPVVLKIDNNVDLKTPSGVEFAVQIEEQINRPIKVPAMAASKKRKRRSKEEIAETEQSSVLPEGSVQKRKRLTIGSPLRLIFDKTNPLPAKDTIETELGKFGALKRIESPISEDKQSTVCVIFERKADAKQASQKLTKTNPFGPILLKHELEESGTSMALKNLAMRALKNGGIKAEALKTEQPHRPDVARRKLSAVTLPLMAASQPGEGPPLDLIKRNLEMMTSMLQKSGDNLSPETKAKLELEIQGLMGKVSSMV